MLPPLIASTQKNTPTHGSQRSACLLPAFQSASNQSDPTPADSLETHHPLPLTRYDIHYEVPDRWTFYKDGFLKHFFKERREGMERFRKEVLQNKSHRLMLFGSITLLSALLASASTSLRTLMQLGIIAVLMPVPILSADKAIPKLTDAYRVAKQGNPKKADTMFADAVDEFNYSVFQRFFKPLSYAVLLTTLLTLPQNLAKPKTQWGGLIKYYSQKIGNLALRRERFPAIHPHQDADSRTMLESMICWPLEKVDRLFAPQKGHWSTWLGDRLERLGWKRDYQFYPLLTKLNHKLRAFGDDVEDWLRQRPILNKALGKPPLSEEVEAKEHR